jgi:ubiquinone/menaquinone biosynthesis C-methylase UbiE
MLNTNHEVCDVKTVHLYNESYSKSYRDYDNEFVNTPYYTTFVPLLKELTLSFNRPIKVLDLGCGTGRYFHALQNTVELTGIDIAAPMLKLAVHPLKEDEVNIPVINLIEGSAFEHDFGEEQFDFIYSIGVLGEHAPFTADMCDKLYSLLTDEGMLMFTVVDIDERKNFKRKLAETAYPLLPEKIKHILDKRWETNYMTYKQLDAMMRGSRFDNYNIERISISSRGWTGGHLKCTANKYDTISRPFFE